MLAGWRLSSVHVVRCEPGHTSGLIQRPLQGIALDRRSRPLREISAELQKTSHGWPWENHHAIARSKTRYRTDPPTPSGGSGRDRDTNHCSTHMRWYSRNRWRGRPCAGCCRPRIGCCPCRWLPGTGCPQADRGTYAVGHALHIQQADGHRTCPMVVSTRWTVQRWIYMR